MHRSNSEMDEVSRSGSITFKRERRTSLAQGVSSEDLLAKLRKKDLDESHRWSDMLTIAMETKIHRQIRTLSKEAYTKQGVLAIVSIINVVLAIVVNELCSRREYVSDVLEQKESYPDKCHGGDAAEYVKIAQIVVTLILLTQVFIQERVGYQIAQCEKRLLMGRRKIGTGRKNEVQVSRWLITRYVVEFLVCCPINIPWLHYRTHVTMRGLRVEYRLEAIICAVIFIRLYHLWRWLHMLVYYRYLNLEESYLLQDKQTLMMLENSQTNYSFLAFKVAVSRQPLRMIATGAGIFILTVSYLVRLAEGPAGQAHSVYVWDQLWFVCVTLTTTGYGDIVPVSHMGRFAAFIVMAIGPVVTAFITATTTRSLSLSSDEQKIVRSLDANHIKMRICDNAAQLIQDWWLEVREWKASVRQGSFQRRGRAKSFRHGVSNFATSFSMSSQKQTRKPRDNLLWSKFYASVGELTRFQRRLNPLMTFDPQMQKEELDEAQDESRRLQRSSSMRSSSGGGVEEGLGVRLQVAKMQGTLDMALGRLSNLERGVSGLSKAMARIEAHLGTAGSRAGSRSSSLRPDDVGSLPVSPTMDAIVSASAGVGKLDGNGNGDKSKPSSMSTVTADITMADARPVQPETPANRRNVSLLGPPSPPPKATQFPQVSEVFARMASGGQAQPLSPPPAASPPRNDTLSNGDLGVPGPHLYTLDSTLPTLAPLPSLPAMSSQPPVVAHAASAMESPGRRWRSDSSWPGAVPGEIYTATPELRGVPPLYASATRSLQTASCEWE